MSTINDKLAITFLFAIAIAVLAMAGFGDGLTIEPEAFVALIWMTA